MKRCSSCGIEKPLEQFYKHKGCADGHIGQCKSCCNEKSNSYRKTEAGKTSVRKYQQSESFKENRKRYLQSEAGKAAMARGAAKFAVKHPKQAKANYVFRNAVRLGKVTPMPCMVCGTEKAEGHHPDYDQPLSVVWLCRPHHLEIHNNNRREVNK